jgi:hypothetical protein
MPDLYAMDPITCNSCGALFESSMLSRIGLWLFITALSAPVVAWSFLPRAYHSLALIVGAALAGTVVLGALIGAVIERFHPWQIALWNDRPLVRAVVNYGALGTFLLFVILVFAYKWRLSM